MINYLLRRVVYGILILLGVNLITFVLFFAVNTLKVVQNRHDTQVKMTF